LEAEVDRRVDWVNRTNWPYVMSSRTYAWDGNGFKETGEATDLQGPTGTELSVQTRGARGVDELGQDFVAVDVTVRNQGRVRSSPLRLAMVVPFNLQPAGPGWDGCVSPAQFPYLNLTPSPGEFTGAFAVLCHAPAIDPGQALDLQFRFLMGDGPNAAVQSASSPSPSWPPDPSFLPGPKAPPGAPALETISVEVDHQPPGEYERDRSDNTVQFPMP
jgi:hypothetical protein